MQALFFWENPAAIPSVSWVKLSLSLCGVGVPESKLGSNHCHQQVRVPPTGEICTSSTLRLQCHSPLLQDSTGKINPMFPVLSYGTPGMAGLPAPSPCYSTSDRKTEQTWCAYRDQALSTQNIRKFDKQKWPVQALGSEQRAHTWYFP